jgi:hypothetical protein
VLGRPEAELKKVLIAPRIEVRRPEVFSVQEVERLFPKARRSCGSERCGGNGQRAAPRSQFLFSNRKNSLPAEIGTVTLLFVPSSVGVWATPFQLVVARLVFC